jgi:hypothetical protein
MMPHQFPGCDCIYRLGGGASGSPFMARVELSTMQGLAALRGELAISEPIHAVWAMGRRGAGDIVWGTNATTVLVSDKVKGTLTRLECTGWSTFPVELLGADREPIAGYSGFVVHGRCGPIQSNRSIPLTRQYPGGTYTDYRGYFFDEASWDGSDIFLPLGDNALIFVTERVRVGLQKATAKQFQLERADMVERATLD